MKAKAMVSFVLGLFLLAGCAVTAQQKLVAFEKNGRWGYKDQQGRVVIAPKYRVAGKFSSQGLAAVADDTSWAYIDTTGKVVVRPYVYDNGPDYFSQDLARYTDGGKIGFFNPKGQIVIPARFDFALPFHEGLAAFCQGCAMAASDGHQSVSGGKWGYVDQNGQVVIEPQFEAARSFSGGRAKVRLKGRWGYIDLKGNFSAQRQ